MIEFEDCTVCYDDSLEAKERVFQIVLDWFKEVKMFSPEVLGQCDTTYIEAPNLVGALAEDGFKFKEIYKD